MQIRRSYFDEERCFDIITQHVKDVVPSRLAMSVFDPEYRNSSSVFLYGDELKEDFKNITNKEYKNYELGIQFTEYNAGQFYKWHDDHNRVQSHSLVLNDDFKGGDFVIRNDEEGWRKTFKLGTGDVISFDSSLLHKVEPVRKGVRYALVCWVLDGKKDLPKNFIEQATMI